MSEDNDATNEAGGNSPQASSAIVTGKVDDGRADDSTHDQERLVTIADLEVALKTTRPNIYAVAAWSLFVSIVAAWLVAISLYAAGAFDRQLATAGLSVKDCAVNISGTVLCGQQLDSFKELTDGLNSDSSGTSSSSSSNEDLSGDDYCDESLDYDYDCP